LPLGRGGGKRENLSCARCPLGDGNQRGHLLRPPPTHAGGGRKKAEAERKRGESAAFRLGGGGKKTSTHGSYERAGKRGGGAQGDSFCRPKRGNFCLAEQTSPQAIFVRKKRGGGSNPEGGGGKAGKKEEWDLLHGALHIIQAREKKAAEQGGNATGRGGELD